MSTERDIGALEAKVAGLEVRVTELQKDVKQLLAILNAGRGTWRTIVAFGVVATSLGAGVATVVSWFR